MDHTTHDKMLDKKVLERKGVQGTMEQNAKDIAQILKVIGNENRVLILCQLMNAPLTVTELSERLSHISQSALSQHLAVLKAHDILDSRKKGLHITYSLKDNRILSVLEVIRLKFCVTPASDIKD